MSHLVVIGAGPMGLASAYYALNAGFDVTVVEADDRPGGMAAHFDFDGITLERYYHFCCRNDVHTLHLLNELNLSGVMRWIRTRMGFYVDGKFWKPLLELKSHAFADVISRITDVETSVHGLWIADTSFYYPQDRGVFESIRFAQETISGFEAENA